MLKLKLPMNCVRLLSLASVATIDCKKSLRKNQTNDYIWNVTPSIHIEEEEAFAIDRFSSL